MPRTLTLLALLFAFTIAPGAFAQSGTDLKQENADLRQRVSELEKELETAYSNITLLQNEVKRLRSARSSSGETTATPTDTAPTATDDPFSSPGAFVAAIASNYKETFDEIDTSNPRERAGRLRALRGWSNDARRTYSGQISWSVTLDTSSGDGLSRQSATFRAVDSVSGQPTGVPFEVRLNSRLLRNLRGTRDGTVWMLEGELAPRISTSANRATADDAGDGIFVGTYAELAFDIKVDSLTQK